MVPVLADLLDEPDETLYLQLTLPLGAVIADAQGTGTILDDDPSATLAVASVTVLEGDSGNVDAAFVLTLSAPSSRAVRVDYSTSDGTASGGSDYLPKSGYLEIPPGETEASVVVEVFGDLDPEDDETFLLVLSNLDGAEAGELGPVGTIRDDDLRELSIDDVAVDEGDSGTVAAVFTVSMPRPTNRDVSVDFVTVAGSASEGTDYLPASGTLTLPRGATSTTLTVAVRGDVLLEDDETFTVLLTNPVAAVILDGSGRGTIRNDEQCLGLNLTVGDVQLYEGDSGTTDAIFTVRLSCPVEGAVTVDFTTADGTAMAGTDYVGKAGELVFPEGTTTLTVAVPVIGDEVHERHEVFHLDLANAEAKLPVVLADPRGDGRILNDDFCARSPGFWKTHTELWPVDRLTLGGREYSAAQLRVFLDYGGPDASLQLTRQLVATKLNLAVGSDPAIVATVAEVDLFLVDFPPGSNPRGQARQRATAFKDQLDAYNNPDCEEDPVIPPAAAAFGQPERGDSQDQRAAGSGLEGATTAEREEN